jgi:saccharopine dehydrogenase-like NADP-dependent oxidoreductase
VVFEKIFINKLNNSIQHYNFGTIHMKKIIVLGAGNMGAYIASNLAEDYYVTLVDYSDEALGNVTNKNITKQQADLSRSETITSDFVISALPEAFGFEAITSVIKAGKNIVDISFWEQSEERLKEIDKLAKENMVIAFIDSGIAPGFSNATVEFFDNKLDGNTKNVKIYVGGIPKERSRGFFAPWSIEGLIEEYQRDALYVKDGTAKKMPALSIREQLQFPKVGELDAAITDGLRSIVYNLNYVPNMAEFTLRYPGHFDQMNMLRNIGYFHAEDLDVGSETITSYGLSQILLKRPEEEKQEYESVLKELGFFDEVTQYTCTENHISPREVAVSVLSKKWVMKTDDRDILVMSISADDGKTEYTADVYAEHDGTYSAMAITTGGMAALAARAIISGKFENKGVFPLEKVIKVKPGLMPYYIEGMKMLGVKYSHKKTKLLL